MTESQGYLVAEPYKEIDRLKAIISDQCKTIWEQSERISDLRHRLSQAIDELSHADLRASGGIQD